ncbi:MAG TPA: hypothetical protein VEQ59_21095, partial [Polyangiaceae bacterium]|nr:hypothetical protein [Polyangiaceae bacterium]
MEDRIERESNGAGRPSSHPRLIAEANVLDLAEAKAKVFDLEGQLQAVHKTQAVIQFEMNGNV